MSNIKNSTVNFLNLSMSVCLIVLYTHLCYGSGLTADPPEITFNNLHQEYTIKILKNGSPIKGGDIKGWNFFANSHSYNHMISVVIQEDKILIKPAELESGSYELVFNTAYGKIAISVKAPLDQLFGSIEDRARMTGKTVEEAKRELGLYTLSPRSNISITIPPQYYEGQTLELKIDGDKNHLYIWKVNNKVVTQGIGKTTFEYTFSEPGEYTLELMEKDKEHILGSAVAKTKVIPYEPIKIQTKMNQPITLKGPPGYSKYKWSVDGVVQSQNSIEATFKFNAEREFKVECIASQPKDGNPNSFARTTYIITVSKR
ncbi:MAG: hypothetical protein N3G21_04110 [Candidatus Hydrogenedentes bacterium]|nr:hypothetical protein [Candidatus Hydrogenedentota bacterium]